MRLFIALLVCANFAPSSAQQYHLQSLFSGLTFFDNFNFWTAGDPTLGYMHYVDRPTAEQNGLISSTSNMTRWGVDTTQVLDPMANLGRLSVRLTSQQSWTHGLFILDLAHMPANQCGVWPAWWMLGSGTWPENGEIDIIEFTNNLPNNLMALHTAESANNCTVAGADQSGTLLTSNCAAGGGYTGCGVSATKPNNAGSSFNQAAGGVYAMEWTSTAVRVWFFSRDEVPASITEAAGDADPDPTTFGVPVANFQGSCEIDAHFFNMSMVFDTTFCGSYAGNTWEGAGCPLLDPTNGWQSCNNFVANNPRAFIDTYWEVNYLKVYQTAAGVQTTSSSSLSSVTPVARTSSISSVASGAQGRSSTPSGIPSLVTTTPTSTPASTQPTPSVSSLLSAASPPLSLSSTTTPVSEPVYATTVVVVVTVAAKHAGSGHHGTPLPAPLGLPGSISPRAVDELPSSSTISATSLVSADILQHVKAPTIARSDRTLKVPTFTHRPPPGIPYVGPDGIVHMPPKAKREAEPQKLGGGNIGYCGVPGSACIEHRKDAIPAAEITSAPTAISAQQADSRDIVTNMKPPTLASSWDYLLGPVMSGPETWHDSAGNPHVWTPAPYTPTFFSYDPLKKRAASTTVEVHINDPTIASSMDWLMAPVMSGPETYHDSAGNAHVWTPPPYTPTFFSYVPLAKRTAEPIIPTMEPDADMSPYTPTTFSYVLPTKRDDPLQPTAPVNVYPKEGSGKPSTTGKHHHISSVTCTPVIMLGESGVPEATGCYAPVDTSITKSEPVVVAHTTRTASIPTGKDPEPTLQDWQYNGYIDRVTGTAVTNSLTAMSSVILVATLAAFAVWL
ncbi:hypothetical protein LTR27_005177 [Elasticomyces elasticus]|nr:hypothetical protein LTR27_005177 [Elasticomyces elasticus]